jgi:APA family basic amino acid/polyamine antiporter
VSTGDQTGSAQAQEGTRGRSIGLVPCLAFAVGTMVGGGVFTLSGTAINEAGPAALLSYLIAGVVMFLSALCFVAVSARARPGDSGYGPVGTILGPGWRFLVMWGFYLNALTITTFLLVSFGDYLHQYFVAGAGTILAALVAVIALTALNLGTADIVGRAETYVVAVKLAVLVFLAAWGLSALAGPALRPFAPTGAGSILGASALLFTAYTGFNVVTNMAGSIRSPRRNVPLAVMLAVLISGLVYLGVVVAMLASGVRHFGPAGVSDAATALIGAWGGYLVAFAACLSTLSGANANILSGSEITLKLVAQGDLPPAVDRIVVIANVTALVAMIVVNAAAFRLARRGWPGEGMRLPGGVLLPTVATLACLTQFASIEVTWTVIAIVLMLGGLILFFLRHEQRYGRGVAEGAAAAILALETPLARSLRRREAVKGDVPLRGGVSQPRR